ncbi:hypothetical protein LUZ60_012720 [Juncus effusus]|nr:hypothetical protein LUZ60_012720 [Juncus effusus]
MEQQEQHFLVVVLSGQGHISPNRSLAKRLSKTTGANVTFSATVAAHRLMFPSLSDPTAEISDGFITYKPYSDGYDHGVKWFEDDMKEYNESFSRVGPATLSSILDDFSAQGRPVTFIVYSMQMYWVKKLALTRGIPTAFYWIQTATMFGIYYHSFHGYHDLISSHLDDPSFVVEFPHMPLLRISDLPSLLTDQTNETFKMITETMRLTIESSLKPDKHGGKSMVLINTFEELEVDAIKSIKDVGVEVLSIGPDIPSLVTKSNEIAKSGTANLFKTDDENYLEWLDKKPERSVVYVSFGSILIMSEQQLEQMHRGLKMSSRPYLWVLRKNNGEEVKLEEDKNGMVVEWCDQIEVLSHPSIGCFVTHCGWNSTLESLTCGVPTVAVPQWTDQHTNARMMVERGVGVIGEVNKEGILEAEKLVSSLETVMGDGARSVEIKKSSEMWRDKAREAVRDGSSYRNFKYFLERIARF